MKFPGQSVKLILSILTLSFLNSFCMDQQISLIPVTTINQYTKDVFLPAGVKLLYVYSKTNSDCLRIKAELEKLANGEFNGKVKFFGIDTTYSTIIKQIGFGNTYPIVRIFRDKNWGPDIQGWISFEARVAKALRMYVK